MGFLIFIIGFICILYLCFSLCLQLKKEIENDPIFKDDIIDYDGQELGKISPNQKKKKKEKINI